MKVEQRVGRIDRIGQKHEEIFVLNLCVLESVENGPTESYYDQTWKPEDVAAVRE